MVGGRANDGGMNEYDRKSASGCDRKLADLSKYTKYLGLDYTGDEVAEVTVSRSRGKAC